MDGLRRIQWLPLAMALVCSLPACKDDETTGAGEEGITSTGFPGNSAILTVGGGPAMGTLTGGTPPYSIVMPPDTTVATAILSGPENATLTISPVRAGTTSVIIGDGSPPAADHPAGQTLTITISVSTTGAIGISGSGSLSVSTTVGMFSADGVFDLQGLSGDGVGGLRGTGSGGDTLTVFAYNARSLTDVDVAVVMFLEPEGTLLPGEFPFAKTTGQTAQFAIGFSINLLDTADYYQYVSIGGSAVLTGLTATDAGAAFSGSAIGLQKQVIDFSNGTMSVTGYGSGGLLGKQVERVARRFQRELTRQR